MKKYDVITIGSGGGGKISSPASKLGYKVAVIEKDALGGTCLNRGCIPSKMLIHPADVACEIKEAKKFGINVDTNYSVNFDELVTRISNTVDSDSNSIGAAYEKNPNLDHYAGHARFVSNNTVEVNGERLTADKIFISVGARPQIPEIEGLKNTPFMTSTEALRNTDLPKKMIVIGASYIACELGHAYGALGTEVHFLVRSKLLRREDSQISEEFHRVFSEIYNVHVGAVPTKVEYNDGIFTVISENKFGSKKKMTADALLVATGITHNTDQLGLENTNVEINPNGTISVDDHLQTKAPGVYALGDCVGNYYFRHSVNFEGEYLFRTLFIDKSDEAIQYPPVPHAIFTRPQVAGVGKTEDELIEEGVDYVAGVNPYIKSAMGMALLADHGFVKILVDKKSRKLLGAHIIGPEASDMIHMLIAFLYKEATLDDLLGMIYIHPALPEIVRNAARKAKAALDTAQQKAGAA